MLGKADGDFDARQILIADVSVGDSIDPSQVHLSLQKLAMLAGANRDFAPIHFDPSAAQQVGAPTAFGNVMFIMAMMEMAIMSWGGVRTRLRKLGPFRMIDFNPAGATVTCRGVVSHVERANGLIKLNVWLESNEGRRTVDGSALVALPISPVS